MATVTFCSTSDLLLTYPRVWDYVSRWARIRTDYVRHFTRGADCYVLGSYSRYFPKERRREVLLQHVVRDNGVLLSPSGWARCYARGLHDALGLRWHREQAQACMLPQPLSATPYRGEGVYVDVHQAYYSILCAVGLGEVQPRDYFSDYGVLLPFTLEGKSKNVKQALRLIPTVGRGGKMAVVRDSEVSFIRSHPIEPRLWARVLWPLHGIAALAVELGAKYYHTDGAIFTSETAAVRFMNELSGLGLEARVKGQGEVEVRAAMCYQFLDQPDPRVAAVRPREYNNIVPFPLDKLAGIRVQYL